MQRLAEYVAANWLEIAGVATTVCSIWLTTQRKMLCWPVTLVANAIYLALFYRAELYSSAWLQLVFEGFTVYGWWSWWRDQQAEGEVRVARLTRRGLWIPLAAGVLGAVVLGWLMEHTDAKMALLDATLASFSLVASWWQARRNTASWWLWIAVDVCYVGEYLAQRLVLTSLLYVGLVGLCALGLRDWMRAPVSDVGNRG